MSNLASDDQNLPTLTKVAAQSDADTAPAAFVSGQTEGQITRLKLLKRSMYGRAKFDLHRLRVLHRAEDNQKEHETSRIGHKYKHSLTTVQ